MTYYSEKSNITEKIADCIDKINTHLIIGSASALFNLAIITDYRIDSVITKVLDYSANEFDRIFFMSEKSQNIFFTEFEIRMTQSSNGIKIYRFHRTYNL